MLTGDLAKIQEYVEATDGVSFHSSVWLPDAATDTRGAASGTEVNTGGEQELIPSSSLYTSPYTFVS